MPDYIRQAALTQEVISRFWDRVALDEAGCWIWQAGVDKDGYGQLWRPGGHAPIKTHRASWLINVGPIPRHSHVLHHCNKTRCVRPGCLFLGDQDANMKDAASKGRLSVGHPNARTLSAEAEAEIIDIYRAHPTSLPDGLRERLAKQHGVTPTYISMIGRGSRVRASVRGSYR